MSPLHLTASSSTGPHQDTTLPLQLIPASHPTNHRANVPDGSKDKIGLPMHDDASAEEPSSATPESHSENASPDVAKTSVEMSDKGGCPLQRCPNATEAETDISWDDGRTSRAGQHLCDELDASPETRGPFSEYVDIFDAEDERKMVTKYINTVADGKIWPSTRLCGHPPIPRRHGVESSLQERLFSNMFASAVNDTSAAMGGPLCYWVTSIHFYEPKLSMVGVRIAEEGSIHVLGNVQHSRLLPFHNRDLLCEPSRALSPMDVPEDVSVFEDDEEFATEFGDPETEEWSGEFDETETF